MIKFVLAMAIPVEDFSVEIFKNDSDQRKEEREHQKEIEARKNGRTFHASESPASEDMKSRVLRAREKIKKAVFEKKPELVSVTVLLLMLDIWKDGFVTNRTKSNHKGVTIMTMTVSPPKAKINGLNNTFIVAFSTKHNNAGWAAVEERLFREIAEGSDPANPMMVYSGALQKMVVTHCDVFAMMEDKVERADATSTLGCTSPVHQRFGVNHLVVLPKVKKDVATAHFIKEQSGNADDDTRWGWIFDLVSDTPTSGGTLPSCYACRRANLLHIGLKSTNKAADECLRIAKGHGHHFCGCADWTLGEDDEANKLTMFDLLKNYPTKMSADCPVPVPKD